MKKHARYSQGKAFAFLEREVWKEEMQWFGTLVIPVDVSF